MTAQAEDPTKVLRGSDFAGPQQAPAARTPQALVGGEEQSAGTVPRPTRPPRGGEPAPSERLRAWLANASRRASRKAATARERGGFMRPRLDSGGVRRARAGASRRAARTPPGWSAASA